MHYTLYHSNPKQQSYNSSKFGCSSLRSKAVAVKTVKICKTLKQFCKSLYILIVVDASSRFVFLRPLENKSALVVARTLLLIFADFGIPKIMQSDNGRSSREQHPAKPSQCLPNGQMADITLPSESKWASGTIRSSNASSPKKRVTRKHHGVEKKNYQ